MDYTESTLYIEGIGPKYELKLSKAGIATINDLCEMDVNAVYERTHISKNRLKKWRAMAGLLLIPAVDNQIAEVLLHAGFTTVEDIGKEPARVEEALRSARSSQEKNIIPESYPDFNPEELAEEIVRFASSGDSAALPDSFHKQSVLSPAKDIQLSVGFPEIQPESEPGLESNIPISTCKELQDMGKNLSGYYYLAQDIDCSDCGDFEPIGTEQAPFTGTFDGRGCVIRNLTINKPDADEVGLFGHVGAEAEICNVGLEDSNVCGSRYVGGLAGFNKGSIHDCHFEGSVDGLYSIGGLVGVNEGPVNNCRARGDIEGSGTVVGGLIGRNWFEEVSNSYSTGTVTGDCNVGGLVGYSRGNILRSYSNCTVTTNGRGFGVGGLVGGFHVNGTISDSYSTGDVTANAHVGGLVGIIFPPTLPLNIIIRSYSTGHVSGSKFCGGLAGTVNCDVVASYWDTEASGQESSSGGEGKTTLEMRNRDTFDGWDFDNTWDIYSKINDGYPYLRNLAGQGMIPISTCKELQDMSKNLSGYYYLTRDIDCSCLGDFEPIGTGEAPFTGAFDGRGHIIRNLTINKPDADEVGLFGHVGAEAEIYNVGLKDSNVCGCRSVGGLVGFNKGKVHDCHFEGSAGGLYSIGGLIGYNEGSINNCHARGDIEGSGSVVGGLVGRNNIHAEVSNSYSTGTVTGDCSVGGLVGYNLGTILCSCSNSTVTTNGRGYGVGGLAGQVIGTGGITDSYSTGNVTGNAYVGGLGGGTLSPIPLARIVRSYSTGRVSGDKFRGGLVGHTFGQVTDSYWDIETSGESSSCGGEGKTTLEMQQSSTFDGWDFDNIWSIDPSINNGYPHLANLLPPL